MLSDPALIALSQVLRTGSFDAAARSLGLTPSAISQRIKGLEDRLGTPLVHRTQPCTGTAAGQRLLRHADEVALLEAALARDLPALGPAALPHLRLAVNADSLATWVIPALAACADMLFDLVVDDQDHAADWLQRGEVLAALSTRGTPVTGCDVTALGRLRYRATASPAFMARHFPAGVTADALARAPCMTFNPKDRLQRDWIAQVWGRPVLPPTHLLPSTHAFVDAALAGLGWGMNPEPLVRDHLAAGRLVELVPDTPLDTALFWQVRRLSAPALAPLTAALRQAARAGLHQHAPAPRRSRQSSTNNR